MCTCATLKQRYGSCTATRKFLLLPVPCPRQWVSLSWKILPRPLRHIRINFRVRCAVVPPLGLFSIPPLNGVKGRSGHCGLRCLLALPCSNCHFLSRECAAGAFGTALRLGTHTCVLRRAVPRVPASCAFYALRPTNSAVTLPSVSLTLRDLEESASQLARDLGKTPGKVRMLLFFHAQTTYLPAPGKKMERKTFVARNWLTGQRTWLSGGRHEASCCHLFHYFLLGGDANSLRFGQSGLGRKRSELSLVVAAASTRHPERSGPL